MVIIQKTDATRDSFANSFKQLRPEIKQEAVCAIADILRQPMPARLRFEKLSGYRNPSIYTIHITRNHSHKLSFEIQGTTAILRKIGTHKEIDRVP